MFPGSFDPLTKGHLDVMKRGAAIFDHFITAVVYNPNKTGFFPIEYRVKLIEQVINQEKLKNIKVQSFTGLLVDYMKTIENPVIVKGIRNMADFQSEFDQANMNKQIGEGVDTLFIATSPDLSYISSTLVREIAKLKGNISQFVHPIILDAVQKKIQSS